MIDRIDPQDAKRRMNEEGYAYLDVRTVPEFEQGHPTGAYNLPWMHLDVGGLQPNPDFLPTAIRIFAKDHKLIVGCQSGKRSMQAAKKLLSAGFTHIVDLRAGYEGVRNVFGQVMEAGWQTVGLPISLQAREGRAWKDLR